MQVVILAAGKGTRMGNLTKEVPKPLLSTGGKTLLEHKFDALPDIVDSIVLVVGFHGDKIKNYFGDTYKNIPILYAYQKELNGTAGAIHAAKDLLEEEFIVMMGDDIYDTEDIKEIARYKWGILAKEVNMKESGGEVILGKQQTMSSIREERHYIERGYVNAAMYKLSKRFLDVPMERIAGRDEYGLPHTLARIAKKESVMVLVTDRPWTQITNKTDLKNYEKILK